MESIDISDLNFGKPISSKKALADVTPIEWDNSVINGKNKIIVSCDTCKNNDLEWYEEPCDSCTVGGKNNHYERKEE